MKKIVALIMTLVTFCCGLMCQSSASAANVCYSLRGNLTQSVSFRVDVGKKIFATEKIVLEQTRGSTLQTFYGKSKFVDMYGRFYISVYDETDDCWVYCNEKWKDKKFTIKSSKLKKKHSYTITVTGDTGRYVGDSYSYAPYVFNKWNTYPTWKATKTGKNITYCG